MRTRLTESFGIKYPIVCAPMALVTGGALAAAVSRAGGLGHKFGVGFISWARALLGRGYTQI